MASAPTPKTITILGINVQVKEVENRKLKDKDNRSTQVQGDSDFSSRLIRLGRKGSIWEKKRTLIHEAFHLLMEGSGNSEYFDDKDEEALCKMAENLISLFTDPTVVAWLNDGKVRIEENNKRQENGHDQ